MIEFIRSKSARGALLVCVVLFACGKPGEEATTKQETAAAAGSEVAVPAQAQTQTYQCQEGKSFTLRVLPDTVWLELPNRTVRLPKDDAAAGTRFSNGDVDFSVENGSARLETEETTYVGCRS